MNPNDMQNETSVKADDNEKELAADSGIDWQYWINLPFLTDLEIAALTLGLNPDQFNNTNFEDIGPDDSINYKLKLRIRFVERSMQTKNLASKPNLKGVLKWINTYSIDCANVFFLQTNRFKTVKNYRDLYLKSRNECKKLKEDTEEIPEKAGKRIKTINEIIYALAWGVFEFSDKNNSASKKIHGLVTDAGFNMTEQTVRAQLNAAHNYLHDKNRLPNSPYKLVYKSNNRSDIL